MHSLEYENKITSLRNAVQRLIEDSPRQEYPKDEVIHFFSRYKTFRDGLRSDFPSDFSDLPELRLPLERVTARGTPIVRRQDVKSLALDMDYCLEMLGSMHKEPEPGGNALAKEVLFEAGKEFDAHREIDRILQAATSSVRIIDGYIDADLFALLSDKKQGVTVDVLTYEVSDKTKLAAEKFNRQHGGLALRTSKRIHDRFLIVDEKHYHLGASIKDAGKKTFMFTLLEEPSVIRALEETWGKEWQAAVKVL